MLPPLPNLFFTRDVAMGINDHVMIGSMRYGVRWTEELIMKAIFRYNPRVANKGILYDGSREHRLNYTLEGGDVHPLRRDTLMIGFSERSSPGRDRQPCDICSSRSTDVTDLIIVIMPGEDIGDSSRHDLHPGRSRALRRSSAAFHGSRAAADSSLEERAESYARNARLFPRTR